MSTTNQDPPSISLWDILNDTTIRNYIQACILAFTYGIFGVMIGQITITYFKRERPSRAQRWMFAICVATFLLYTSHVAMEITGAGLFFFALFAGSQSPLGERMLPIFILMDKLTVGILWMRNIAIIISDAVVVWRAFVLLNQRRWLAILPFILLLGSLASSLAYSIRFTMLLELDAIQRDPLFMTSYSLSLATNVAATGIIGYAYWLNRRNKVVFGIHVGKHRFGHAEQVLGILMESGVVFCLFQLINATATVIPGHMLDHSTPWWLAISALFIGFTAMYPTMVIALVNNQYGPDHISSPNPDFLPLNSEMNYDE